MGFDFMTQGEDRCASMLCKNGGTCVNGFYEYGCKCTTDWHGHDCTEHVTPCTSNPCKNGGTCIDGSDTYKCKCGPDWQGYDCTDRCDIIDILIGCDKKKIRTGK